MKVLITPRSFASTSKKPVEILHEQGYKLTFNHMERPFTKEEMLEIIPEMDGVIIGIDPCDEDIIKTARKLKVISKYGTGVDNVDLKVAAREGIVVTNTPEANVEAVADLAFGLLLALARRIPETDRETKAGNWKKIIGVSVWRKTLGIIGLGKIGRHVVKRARGFEMKILGYDIYYDEEYSRNYGVEYVGLEELLVKSDYISIHTPLNKATYNLIGNKELDIIKNTAYLVNTSRGGIVDEEALYVALRDNKLKGAALDAFLEEPLVDSPLKELDNIILTSHMGAYTEEAIENMGIIAAHNLIEVLKGNEPENRLN